MSEKEKLPPREQVVNTVDGIKIELLNQLNNSEGSDVMIKLNHLYNSV